MLSLHHILADKYEKTAYLPEVVVLIDSRKSAYWTLHSKVSVNKA